MWIRRFQFLSVAVLFAVAPAHADDASLTGDQIKELITGRKMSSTYEGKPWSERYLPGGKIKGVWIDNSLYDGKWKVVDDQLCVDYSGSDFDDCWILQVDSDVVHVTQTVEGDPFDAQIED